MPYKPRNVSYISAKKTELDKFNYVKPYLLPIHAPVVWVF